MTQKLFRRLEELEKAALRVQGYKLTLVILRPCALEARVEAMRTDPAIEKRIAESPPDFLHRRVQELRALLMEMSHDNRSGVAA